jgi:hypothetical protein
MLNTSLPQGGRSVLPSAARLDQDRGVSGFRENPGMASRPRRPAAEPLRKLPVRIGPLHAPALVADLRELHERGGDPDVEQMPQDTEL